MKSLIKFLVNSNLGILIRNTFDFEKDGEMFKKVSFREEFNKK
jgi:hypothetical protein